MSVSRGRPISPHLLPDLHLPRRHPRAYQQLVQKEWLWPLSSAALDPSLVGGGGQWISASSDGLCGGGGTELPLPSNTSTWLETADACLEATANLPDCDTISVSRMKRSCVCSKGCARHDAHGYLHGPRTATFVPTALPLLPPFKPSDVAALQLSSHLGTSCRLDHALRHQRACERVFASCEWHIHSWNETEPTTPHWSGRKRRASAPLGTACIARLRSVLRPKSLVVMPQLPAPPLPRLESSHGPCHEMVRDDQGCSRRDPLRDPARLHGWKMNALGMRHAAEARQRASAEALGPVYAVAVRLRPDAKERPESSSLAEDATRRLWHCIALLYRRGEGKTRPAQTVLTTRQRRKEAWRDSARPLLHPCSPTGSLTETARDNCFFGAPHAMDRTLATLSEGGAGRKRLLAETARRGVKPWHPEKRLAVAADLSGGGVGNACHRDTLRYLFA